MVMARLFSPASAGRGERSRATTAVAATRAACTICTARTPLLGDMVVPFSDLNMPQDFLPGYGSGRNVSAKTLPATRKCPMRLYCRRFVLAACGGILFAGVAAAQDYPSRPVKIVVPYPAGGSNDIIARIVAQKLSERSGQNFLVENRGGAGGNIGAEAVAGSEPDGYTLLLTAPPPLTINAALYTNLPFDPAKAFAPVALLASVPLVLAVDASLGV